jgi:hypothetical protein
LLRFHLIHEIGHARHGNFDLIEAGGVAAAHEAFAARAEGAAGDAGDIFLLQQTDGKFAAGEAGRGDIGKNVEGAERLETGEAELIDGAHDVIAAVLEYW